MRYCYFLGLTVSLPLEDGGVYVVTGSGRCLGRAEYTTTSLAAVCLSI